MKKFFAGVSVLVAVVGGLTACSNGELTRESVQQKFYDEMVANTPDALKSIPNYEKVFECMSEKTVSALDDEQLKDFNDLLGKDKDDFSELDVPAEFKDAMEKAAEECQAEYMEDFGN